MKFRALLLHLALSLPFCVKGSETGDFVQRGERALSAGLWEVAVLHFGEALRQPEEDPSRIQLLLAESLIRGGRPAEALPLLDLPGLSSAPGLGYWKGQALAALGRFQEAAGLLELESRNPASPFRPEAAFTSASLLLALNEPDAALAVLSPLSDEPDTDISTPARLRSIEILIDLGRLSEARSILPPPETLSDSHRSHALFLDAFLLLAEGKPDDAAAGFATLLARPEGQTLSRYQASSLGMADALAAHGNTAEAAVSLLDFVQQHPDSALLKPIFERLLLWLPRNPAADDRIIARLAQWIPPPPPSILAIPGTGAAGAFPDRSLPASTDDLAAFALFTRAIGLHRLGTPRAIDESRLLLTRLRFEHPTHFLTARALVQSGRWLIEEGKTDQAFALLEAARESAQSPLLRGESTFLQARAACENGDHALAVRLFDQAADFLEGFHPGTARLNADIARLLQGEPPVLVNLSPDQETPENLTLRADVELEQALSTTPPSEAKTAIETFLANHPHHPRAAEARLASAEAALSSTPPDLDLARARLEAIDADPEIASRLSAPRLLLARIRFADLSEDSAAAIPLARTFLEDFPADPATPEISLILGRNLFQTENHNEARLIFEKLALEAGDSPRAQASWLLAARSAALGATPQSRDEALSLFDRAIDAGGSLSSIARLEKANLLIELNQLPAAIDFLRGWFSSLPENDPLRLPSGLLLGEAIYSRGTGDSDDLAGALAVYDLLLVHAESQPALFNRLQYLRGMTLEQLPRADDPSQKREGEALAAYYSVLENAGETQPAEWVYFERCGLRALGMLEKNQRWQAAIAVAEKIASFQGPGAREAAARARQIRLKQMIW